jgi:subtilisin family serine protease
MIDRTPDGAPASAPPGCLAYGLFAAALVWVCAVVGLSAPVAWFVREVVEGTGGTWPGWADLGVAAAQAALVAAPAGLLAALTREPLLRGAYRSWVAASAGLLAFSLARLLPAGWFQAAALVAAAVGLAALAVLLVARRPGPPAPAGALGVALAAGPLLALPWLAYGALGSPLDTLLALLAGAAVGLAAAAILDRVLLPAVALSGRPEGAALALGGLALGAALLILAAGAGFQAANLLLMAALPPLGLGAVALALPFAGRRRAWLAPAALVAAAAAAPLALFDPDEITVVLGAADIPGQVAPAAAWAFVAGLAVSGLLLAARRLVATPPRAPALLGGVAATALVAAAAYALVGHPGFYGERLFVILRDQAALAPAAPGEPRDERLRRAYATLTAHAEATQAGLRADLGRFGVRSTPYYLVNGLEVDGGPLVRLWLQGRPEVDRVLESPRLRPLPAPPPPEPGDEAAPAAPEWNITSIGADRVWSELGVTGEGVVIGQSDSGVDGAHPALRDGFRGGADSWLDPWYGSAAPRDYGMHGTHTLGSALGRGGIGVAPGASWFGCVNLARNLGNPARYLDCLQFMLAPYGPGGDPLRDGDPARAADVINNSWGCPPVEGCDADSLRPAIDALRAAGVFVVVSAGNEGPSCSSLDSPPAIYDSALSVGAIDQAGDVTPFSSRGPVEADGSGRTKPDIVAPGAEILSAQPGDTYGRADGTSMAGPHVAGVVALMWSANPALVGDIERTEQILRDTARPHGGAAGLSCAGADDGSNVYGRGVVDAYAAVRAAQQAR